MKLKEWYEKLYDKIFAVPFFKMFLKIPGLEKLLQYEVISYLFFGVLTTVVNFVVSFLCNKAGGENYGERVLFSVGAFDFRWTYMVQTVAWIASVLFAFVTNKLFVFESRSTKAKDIAKEITSFFGARILSFLVFELLLFAVAEKVLLHFVSPNAAYWLAKTLFSGILVIVFNYVASKLVIFKKKDGEKEK